MMRKPSEYIAAAARNIRDHLMDDCRMRLTHGDESAMVTRAASVTRGEDEVTDFGASEQVRVLSLASDFPTITKGSVATLGEHTRIVTSVRTDCAGASRYIGLSNSLTKYAATISGKRGARFINMPVDILATSNGKQTEYADGYAPVDVYSWTVAIPEGSWIENGEPQIGDTISFDGEKMNISRVQLVDKVFICNARSR